MRNIMSIVVLCSLLPSVVGQSVEQWGCFEITITLKVAGNPFTESPVFVKFQRGKKEVLVRSFYDGDDRFKIRFMPDEVGDWVWSAIRENKSTVLESGRLTVTPPKTGNHGPVRVHDTFHFKYADGTPFRPVGTTCYGWVHLGDEIEKQTLATLKTSPFNKVRMCVLPKWYAYNRLEPPQYPFEGTAPKDWKYDRFNPAFFKHIEERILDLQKLGIEADLILFHPYDEGHWGFDRMTAEADERFATYCVARFGAYRNVWWSLANEFDFMKEKKDADWDRLIGVVTKADLYQHLVSIHNGTRLWNQTDKRLTHASIQNGSAVADFGRAVLYRDVYEKPIVFDEVKYEGDLEQRWGNLSAEEMVHRFWQATIAGSYASHGETYKDSKDMIWWSKGGTLRGQSPKRLSFLRRILDEGPKDGFEPIDKWQDERTAGRRDEQYLVYFGKEALTKWDVDLPGKKQSQFSVSIEVLDTWGMTITPVEGRFELKPNGMYRMSSGKTIDLPGKPYHAVRLKVAK